MSTNRVVDDCLADIIEAIGDIHSSVDGLDYDTFSSDKKTVNAVIRSLGVIGEAVKKVPPELRQEHPDLPWQEIAGTRDKLIREYFGVDLQMLWETIQRDLDALYQGVRSLQQNRS
jgi:uncharacterized protein with HEPN domain